MFKGVQIRWLLGLGLIVGGTARAQGPHQGLSYYVGEALKGSPLLKDYRNQARSNQIDSARIRAGYKPQINGVSSNTYAPTVNGWGYDNAITNGANFSELITFNQRLVGKSNLENQYDALRLQNESLSVTGKISEQDLKKTVATQYITAYGDWQQYQFNQDVLKLLTDEEGLLKQLTEKGVYRQTDYLTFRVTLQQEALTLTQARVQFQVDFAALNYTCGLADTSFGELPAPALDSVSWLDPESTVFYRKFVVDSLVLRNSDALIDYGYKAKVSLYADAGYVSSLAFTPYQNFGFSVGVNITVPIYDGRQRKMQHDKVSIEEMTRANYRDFFKTQYQQQVAQLIQQLQATQGVIDQATEQSRYTRALIDANRKLLATGDVKIADYIIAIGNYLAAQNVITQNTVGKLQIINQINYWNRK
ncbi:TolC family protein [Dinghuibacter silviterrae]|uniref:Outer membrane protein TolC n=1 Tax=Dinghuibacter silviterrae TaxID=1539049 RepID=A0A4R8DGI9_9BACT|nr:TolC family protein [Dinghuibacter silviterrae]TDW96781.1 outer membrane protein TolC [Dinghuibacter silviterrae]